MSHVNPYTIQNMFHLLSKIVLDEVKMFQNAAITYDMSHNALFFFLEVFTRGRFVWQELRAQTINSHK